jgi:hypothetical protein
MSFETAEMILSSLAALATIAQLGLAILRRKGE